MSSHEPTAASTGELPAYRYTAELAQEIESRWQKHWEAEGTYHAANPVGELADAQQAAKPKKLVVDMFPYPSGKGLHVGHPLGYIGTDVYARYHRMLGYNVLHTLGYDSFGLPAEQHAINTGVHPRVNTEDNIANMRRQLARLGLGHDFRRSVSTTDEDFYKWTQWIFLEIFNSWYDTDLDKARPITELIAEFDAGTRQLADDRQWSSLTQAEKRTTVDSYRLAYLADSPVNWCPGLGTILANEEVTAEGRSDIGNYPVFKRNMKQWMLRITTYADRLLGDLEALDWPEAIKTMQRNWIGKSFGAQIRFGSDAGPLEVFTTRPDTLFGASFMVLSPEHERVAALTTQKQKAEIEAYITASKAKSDKDRADDTKEKTGVFTGSYATNPVNGEQIPIWIADYVLMGYGTGAIVAVPCGDERDFVFAQKYGLPIPAIQTPPTQWFTSQEAEPSEDATTWPKAFTDDAPYCNSKNDSVNLNGISQVAEAKKVINAWLEANGHGEATVSYRLRDWLFSRQRYWGEPFPIVYDAGGVAHGVPVDQLPVVLPALDDFKPTAMDPDDNVTEPIPPLARATDWLEVELDLGDGVQTYTREINVMPQWAGSCWYEMRYLDPTNNDAFVDPEIERYWMGPAEEGASGGVDLYVGGVEHAVLHLLYARFWHKVLFDLGHVSSFEPFHRLFNQGYIQAYAYRDDRGQPVDAQSVEERDGSFFYEDEQVTQEYGKMGKSLKNIVTPDDMYDDYGADTFRLYEMSMGPLDASRPWNNRDVIGMARFLQRLWRNIVDEQSGKAHVTDSAVDPKTAQMLHKTIASVTEEMTHLRFNTAIAKLIELNNVLTADVGVGKVPKEVAEPLLIMLAPLAPHIAEELWSKLGHTTSVTQQSFPVADESLLVDETITVVVQVNGKVRGKIDLPADVSEADAVAAVLELEAVSSRLEGNEPRKTIVRLPKIINIVV